MKMLRMLVLPAIVAIASVGLAFSQRPAPTHAQVVYPPVVAALTAACTTDPCLSTEVASIPVPGGSSTCGGDVYGTFQATGIYEVTNVSQTALLAQWSTTYVAPSIWLANTGFSTATSRAFVVHFAAPLKNTSYFRVRLSAYTSGTVNVYLTCAGDPSVVQTLPGATPTSSPTP